MSSFAQGFAALRGLDGLAPPGGPPGLDRLSDDLMVALVDSWMDYHPAVAGVLWALGLYTPSDAAVASAPVEHGGRIVREPWRRPELRLEAIGDLLRDPEAHLLAEYGVEGEPPEVVTDAVFSV